MQDVDQTDLPISPFRRFYSMFAAPHPDDDPHMIVRTEKERFKTFYSVNAQPQKEVWCGKRITKNYGFG